MKDKKQIRGMRIIPEGESKCIWMDAGVVNYKLCNNQFQCTTCQFDKAMSNKVEKEKMAYEASEKSIYTPKPKEDWMEKFRDLPSEQRKCRYMLMGEVSYKVCPNNFNCGNCTFDQMMQDRIQPETIISQASLEKVAGFYLSDSLYYFRNHLWINLERNGKYRIGIDDMARRIIGRIDRLKLPKVGKRLGFEEPGFSIGHEYGELDLFSPLNGVVDQINPHLMEDESLVVKDPYQKGWLMTIEPASIEKSNRNFYKGKTAKAWMIDEADLLVKGVQNGAETMHDGAEITMDISRHLDKTQWLKIARNHLHIG